MFIKSQRYLKNLKLAANWAGIGQHRQVWLQALLVLLAAALLYAFHTTAVHKASLWMHGIEVQNAVVKADTMAEFLDELAVKPTPDTLNPIIAKVNDSPDFRVTVLDLAGNVIADSWLATDEVKALGSYANRPEVSQASRHEPGVSLRYSDIVRKELLYVTHRYQQGNFSGYIRIAIPPSVGAKKIAGLARQMLPLIVMIFLAFLGVNYYIYRHIKREKKLLQEQQETLALLDRQSKNSEQIQKFSQALTTCESRGELVDIMTSMGGHLFGEHTFGALAVSPPSLDAIEIIATWGDRWQGEGRFAPKDCWGFRRGGVHLSHNSGMEINCNHLTVEQGDGVQCVLLQSQGVSLGALHIGASEETFNSGSFQNKIYAVSEQLCLTISNLNLRVKLQQQAIRDPLTALYNRRYLDDSFARELKRAERKKSSLAVMMIDIDHFKAFNDTYGHDAGDLVIKKFSKLLSEAVREEDISCRYGGEEFTLVLNDIDLPVAIERAEALLEATRILELQLNNQSLGQITVSLGIAMYPQHGSTQVELIKAADQALYEAKESGRNQVKVMRAGSALKAPKKIASKKAA